MNRARGFPGILGSVDSMHWKWKNCPKAWHAHFKGRGKDATIILEAVADHETWIWHAYFGMPSSCNDINALDRSPLFANLANREAPPVTFEANGRTYNYGYYLADGIYPRWSKFLKPVAKPEKVGKNSPFIMHKRRLEKMLRGHLGFCNPNLLLCEDHLDFGIKRSFGTS